MKKIMAVTAAMMMTSNIAGAADFSVRYDDFGMTINGECENVGENVNVTIWDKDISIRAKPYTVYDIICFVFTNDIRKIFAIRRRTATLRIFTIYRRIVFYRVCTIRRRIKTRKPSQHSARRYAKAQASARKHR